MLHLASGQLHLSLVRCCGSCVFVCAAPPYRRQEYDMNGRTPIDKARQMLAKLHALTIQACVPADGCAC
jgi:hypothetical protein